MWMLIVNFFDKSYSNYIVCIVFSVFFYPLIKNPQTRIAFKYQRQNRKAAKVI